MFQGICQRLRRRARQPAAGRYWQVSPGGSGTLRDSDSHWLGVPALFLTWQWGLADWFTFLSSPVSQHHVSLHQIWKFKEWPCLKHKFFKSRRGPSKADLAGLRPAAAAAEPSALIGNSPKAPWPCCWIEAGKLDPSCTGTLTEGIRVRLSSRLR